MKSFSNLTLKSAALITAVGFAGLVTYQSCNKRLTSQVSSEHIPDKVSYNFDIRPILSDKCFACHGPDANKREAGLRLDKPEIAFKELAEHPGAHALVAGEPSQSQVFLRVSSKDTAEMMPPPSSNLKLTQREISIIEKWIKQGAKYEKHWAFVTPKKSQIPEVSQEEWPKNEIDRFVLAKMEQQGLEPNAEADKESLLRRVSLDLTGLPPSLKMIDDFLKDESPNAYEKVVDKLLADSAYGEKMALHWLDVARYADSHGYQDDGYRTQWPWRDWVIYAFNKNLPYDQFVTWQLAGDLLPNRTKEQLLATGFNRNHKITEEGGVIPEEYRIAYVTDRNDLFGKALLGVTMECAHCHDHKYDPFSQKEYYEMFAFFNNIQEKGIESVIGGPETYAKVPLMEISDKEADSLLSFVNKKDTNRLIVSVMEDLDTIRPTHLLIRGNYDGLGEIVTPATPKSILPFSDKLPKNRLGLSKWLFDERNPLTSRVYVNQIWQELFGRGLVKTSGDFGMQGELPSHPELLDWLAVDFRENGWDIKKFLKEIVTSATYRQSNAVSEEKHAKDPENVYLARSPRYHLEAETIRDIVLSSSGLINREIGGPSIKPYQPDGLWEGATSGRGELATYVQDHGEKLYRRGMYCFIKRTIPPPNMIIFDASNRDLCEVKRLKTNTPLQALVMMNDPTVLEASRVLAGTLLKEKIDLSGKIKEAYRRILGRQPTDEEVQTLVEYYEGELKNLKEADALKLLNVGEYPQAKDVDSKQQASLMQVIQTIYNLEEAITKS